MKKLKRTKSLLAILLTLCICATLPIATVFAEDENDSVDVMALPGGGSITVETTVRDNYADSNVTDDINLTIGEDYIIDFTKEDNLSIALKSMADLEKTKYYKECETILATDAANVYIQDLPEFVALNKNYTGYEFYPLYVQDIAKLKLVSQ